MKSASCSIPLSRGYISLTVPQSTKIFPIMPCLVSKQHEHHVLLSILMDLSQPCLLMMEEGGGGDGEKRWSLLDGQKDTNIKKNLKYNKEKRPEGKENLALDGGKGKPVHEI